ncbi:hypothetical protein [Streptomyces purpurascens]|uniref:hypothetical protein n=1 Tax=Streptomyces purpurascens TaxID=1924 RepID=UPI00167764EA|nr:hypothetical protein [Streptomyces purpurascens]MCE7048038.1 hypothetical protein [Streptomyces purpurascens]
MRPDRTGGAVVTRRANGLVTTGCLTILIALIVVLGIVVSWLWYRHWHDGNVNREREEKAFASIGKQARATAHDTARALGTSGTTDADALTGVIWQHSEAPVITYDASRREFTATAARSARYDNRLLLPGGGHVEVTRCFVFTYTYRPGQAWTSRISERDDDVCRPGTEIGHMVRLALTRISSMYAEDLTRAGVQDALDPTGRRSFDVKNVVREGDTMTVSVLVSSSGAAVDQCYRFTRPVPGDDGQGSATAVPTLSC